VDTWSAYLDTVTTRVLHQGVRRVEPHRLRVEQGGTERGRVVVLDPRARVDQIRERHGVTLGKAVVGERGELVPDLIDDVFGDPPLGRTHDETLPQSLHTLAASLGSHCLAQLIGF